MVKISEEETRVDYWLEIECEALFLNHFVYSSIKPHPSIAAVQQCHSTLTSANLQKTTNSLVFSLVFFSFFKLFFLRVASKYNLNTANHAE